MRKLWPSGRWRVRVARPSPAMAVALLALLIATGGSAAAVSRYLITSTKQISPKVLKKLRGHEGPRGPEGLQGLAGKEGPTGRDGASGKEGPQGKEGVAGKNLTTQTPLPSGKSESGTFAAAGGWDAGDGKGAFGSIGTSITYVQPLAAPIPNENIVEVTEGSAPHCPGVGKAEANYLCLYDWNRSDVGEGTFYSEPGEVAEFSTPAPGAMLYWEVKEAGQPHTGGEYTVTAP
jgi:hypothetical protein